MISWIWVFFFSNTILYSTFLPLYGFSGISLIFFCIQFKMLSNFVWFLPWLTCYLEVFHRIITRLVITFSTKSKSFISKLCRLKIKVQRMPHPLKSSTNIKCSSQIWKGRGLQQAKMISWTAKQLSILNWRVS